MLFLRLVTVAITVVLLLQATAVSAQERYDYRNFEEPVLEAELDAYLLEPSDPEAENPNAFLESIVAKVTEQTPALTRVRAQSYYAMDLMVYERDEEAWELARQALEFADNSGVIDAIVEAKATIVALYYYTNEEQQGLIELERMQSDLDQA
ncbi:MAG: hypothetical protein HLUCCO02_06325 [Idiomarinaceae bacterium HL-53]|nr:MAG: hypothetical protein HLUCCO02_06325 [Idiomarinaceae bacterium HL-53]